jgi:hypothetical protein
MNNNIDNNIDDNMDDDIVDNVDVDMDYDFSSEVCVSMDNIEKMISDIVSLYDRNEMSDEEVIKFENWRDVIKDMI